MAYPCIFVVIVNGLWVIFYKKTDEWYIERHEVTTNDKEQYNEWQQVTASGTTNENDTVHFKEWMAAILTMTKTDTLLQGMDGLK